MSDQFESYESYIKNCDITFIKNCDSTYLMKIKLVLGSK